MLQLSVALLRLAVASSMASYLVRDEYCGTPLTEGVDLMGAPTVASAGADLAVDAAGAVALTSEKFARYVEYVLESAGGFARCDGAVGCGGTRCAVRRFRGSPAAGATLAAAGAVRYACVGCDFSGFFVELLGVAAALDELLGDRFSVAGVRCDGAAAAKPAGAAALAAAGAARRAPRASSTASARPATRRRPSRGSWSSAPTRRAATTRSTPARAPRRRLGASGGGEQFRAAGVANVAVVPEAVDAEAMSPDAARADAAAAAAVAARLGPRPAFRVLSVFKLERRKGWDVLLDGWWDAFDGTDDVELVVHAYKPSWIPGDGVDKRIQAYWESARILEGARLAGSYKRYFLAPHHGMLALRALVLRGRAEASPSTPLVARLFAGTTTEVAPDGGAAPSLLPDPLFFLVLEFWLGAY
ncbi:glycosyl transferase [Aureococcus anophagefferens]|nr:glycosyl transferase [Aureococcus anophagefferens]